MSQRQQQQAAGETVPAPNLLEAIIKETNLTPTDEGYEAARLGISSFISEMLKPGYRHEKVKKTTVDRMIAEIDYRMGRQIDEILHDKDFQALESAWLGLKLLIDRADFRENIEVEIINLTKDELLDDFLDASEIAQSSLYKLIYTAEYGQFGGKPVGAMIGNYYFGPTAMDIRLLQSLASVAAIAHAPFIAAAEPSFFGLNTFERLPALKDLQDIFSGPRYAKWQSFRESEDSRYVGLTLPRFLLRQPYDPEDNPVKAFVYKENVDGSHDSFLWGNTAFAFASRLTDSFAKYRWCPNIIGPKSGGAVENLPVHLYESMGDIEMKIPTEVLISDRREYELAEQGFIALTMRKGSDNAAFFSASSCQKPKYFGTSPEGKDAELNYRLSTQLPYMFIISRLAHYIKVLQRENIGSWKERTDLERELNLWIRQYVADQENPSSDTRSRRPLRSARITVDEVEGDPGWYRVTISVRPHFKYMGAYFTLSLVGKLDKE
ncbi:MAG: type VI secretion system contractile sheath large subunit [Deltaproteobacteria bacterium]|jgi:type VI secretion system protein ImpC|nr:type VI secretion system contractile sheath large subunit [Deltaproteobacteria bacterium]